MELTALGNYCDITSAKRIYAEEYVEEGIPFYRGKEIIEKSKDQTISEPLFISEDRFNELTTKFGAPEAGDILLTSVGTLGIPYVVQEKDKFYFKDGNLTWLRKFSNELNSKYLYYWLTSDFGKEPLLARAIGSSQGAITIEILKKYKIHVPDREVQDNIVEVLSRYDNSIRLNNNRIKLLEQTAQEIYKEWFVRFRFPGYEKAEFEHGIPEGWEIVKVKNAVKRLPFGTTYKAEELEKEGNVIVIDQSEEELLGYSNETPSHTADYNSPLILFGDHSCKFQLMTKDFSLGENVIPFKTIDNESFSIYYLFFATKELIQTEEYKRHWNRLVNFKIFKPAIALQRQFEDLIKPLKKEKENLWLINRNLIKQRDYLLPRLMSGKLEV